MDKNQQDGTKNKRTANGDKLSPPPLSTIIKRLGFPGYHKKRKEYRLDEQADAAKDGRHLVKITEEHQPGKTVRDVLQLASVILIPLVILFATIRLNQQQTDLANQQHQADQQIANDQQQEATLQTYLDDMSGLLLNNKLLESGPKDVVRQVARERTLTTLRRLDAGRNRIALQFLQDARLIGTQDAVIDLSSADLSNDDLSGVNLTSTDLSGANLSKANLKSTILSNAFLNGANLSNTTLNRANLIDAFLDGANLKSADLSNADLSGADLRYADLSKAILNSDTLDGAIMSGANLSNASLNSAIMDGTNLSGADLSNASLSNAILNGVRNLTQQQLDEVYSCTNATLSTGLTCHRNQ